MLVGLMIRFLLFHPQMMAYFPSFLISVVSATYLLSAPICGMFINLWPEKSGWIMLGGSMLAAFAVLLMGPSPILPIAKSIPSMLSAYALMGFALSPIFIPSFQYCIDSAKLAPIAFHFECYLLQGTWIRRVRNGHLWFHFWPYTRRSFPWVFIFLILCNFPFKFSVASSVPLWAVFWSA